MTRPDHTANLRTAIDHAHRVGAAMGSARTGTEHLLLAILRNDANPGMSILRALHVTPQHLRSMVPRNLNVLAAGPVDPTALAPFTASASKALACATAIAREMDHAFVDTPHLLLAFLRLPECTAARVLAETPQVGHGFGDYLKRIYPAGRRTPDPEPLPASLSRTWSPSRRMMRFYEPVYVAAASRGHGYLGVEHVMYVLARLDGGYALTIMERLQVDIAKLRADTERLLGPATNEVELPPPGNTPLTDAMQRAVTAAIEESAQVESPTLGTGDMLLGVLRDPDSHAALSKAYPSLTLAAAREERRRLAE